MQGERGEELKLEVAQVRVMPSNTPLEQDMGCAGCPQVEGWEDWLVLNEWKTFFHSLPCKEADKFSP